jgi:hypothetical protein
VLLVLSEEPTEAMVHVLRPSLRIKRPFDANDLARSVKILLAEIGA